MKARAAQEAAADKAGLIQDRSSGIGFERARAQIAVGDLECAAVDDEGVGGAGVQIKRASVDCGDAGIAQAAVEDLSRAAAFDEVASAGERT